MPTPGSAPPDSKMDRDKMKFQQTIAPQPSANRSAQFSDSSRHANAAEPGPDPLPPPNQGDPMTSNSPDAKALAHLRKEHAALRDRLSEQTNELSKLTTFTIKAEIELRHSQQRETELKAALDKLTAELSEKDAFISKLTSDYNSEAKRLKATISENSKNFNEMKKRYQDESNKLFITAETIQNSFDDIISSILILKKL